MTEPQSIDGLVLLCRARRRLCALPIGHVIETMRPLPITAFPSAPPFVCGISVIRSAPVPVIDLGALLAAPEPPDVTRFVTLQLAERRVALAVERVVGVREIRGLLGELAPLLGEATKESVSSVAALDTELLLVLQTATLVPESAWSLLDSENRR